MLAISMVANSEVANSVVASRVLASSGLRVESAMALQREYVLSGAVTHLNEQRLLQQNLIRR